MPENEGYATCGYMYKVLDDDEYENLGYVNVSEGGIKLTIGDDELDGYNAALLKQPTCVSFSLDMPWYALNRLYGVLYGRPKYTVSRLRRDRKGHPRCRRK